MDSLPEEVTQNQKAAGKFSSMEAYYY